MLTSSLLSMLMTTVTAAAAAAYYSAVEVTPEIVFEPSLQLSSNKSSNQIPNDTDGH